MSHSTPLPPEFGAVPPRYAPRFSTALAPEQTARVLALRAAVECVERTEQPASVGELVELARYLETGLRSYDDPPVVDTAEAPAKGTDPDVVDAEKIRTAVETVLADHGFHGVTNTRMSGQIVERVFPDAASTPAAGAQW